ncbi:MAG: hypothetical protein Q9225_007117 [Loekoesia sp. 1 TL-2023]
MARRVRVFAAGFNAHGQLEPASKPSNIHSFKQIRLINDFDPTKDTAIKSTLWSSTVIVNNEHHLIHLGISGGSHYSEIDLNVAPSNATFFGDISGVKGYRHPLTADLHTLHSTSKTPTPTPAPPFKIHNPAQGSFLSRNPRKITHIAIAGNDKVCIATLPPPEFLKEDTARQVVHVFSSLESLLKGNEPPSTVVVLDDITDIVATCTSFVLLTGKGTVLTLGDARYPALLGRTPSETEPASHAGLVSALDGIPIRKVVAGSWMVAALSCEKDLYVWGHMLPQTPIKEDHAGLSKLLNASVNGDGEREEVHLVDIADGVDIEDVAVGDEHIIVLTTEGEVWGFGSNEYGQLGLGKDIKGTEGKWVRMDVSSHEGRVVEMKAGPLTTFFVVITKDVP